jgi:hypothetical protein
MLSTQEKQLIQTMLQSKGYTAGYADQLNASDTFAQSELTAWLVQLIPATQNAVVTKTQEVANMTANLNLYTAYAPAVAALQALETQTGE